MYKNKALIAMFSFFIFCKDVFAKQLFIAANSNCNGIFGGNFGSYVRKTFSFIKYIAPLLVIVFTIIDYIKAIASGDADSIKKANSNFIKRLICCVLLFIIPTILDYIFELLGFYNSCVNL